jgi:hypothetical protein
MSEFGKALIGFGLLLVAVGVIAIALGKLHIPLGRLPGDIAYRGKHGTFYFPIITCIVLSILFSLLMWVINHVRK